ncbi:probable protein CLEC16A homolog at N-terminal half [Coccomyxa sp. Obi]|nr:probable protein CLEC16A homolog at N-terminal half [Coccomyxa sp. Obi]
MIWGDQHDPRYFDYFAENNLLHHFTKFLEHSDNRKGDIAKQVLQTLSILIQNIRSTTAIFYLFSNNLVNEIVAMRFDFEDDEVLGYFINLLKTISLKFNSSTVQFFFHDDGERSSFPLYTEAVKFINHRDGMVRAAVRTLTLNVYSIRDPAVQAFVVSKPASNYFNELAIFIAEQCQALDRQLSSLDAGTSAAAFNMENVLAEVEDLLSYCNDILCTGETFLSQLLLQRLSESFAGPILFWPLASAGSSEPSDAGSDTSPDKDSAALRVERGGGVSPACALHVMERLLHVMTHGHFINLLASALLLNSPEPSVAASPPRSSPGRLSSDGASAGGTSPGLQERAASLAGRSGSWAASLTPGSYKQAFMHALRGRDVAVSAAAVRVLCSCLLNKSVDPDILDAAGLLPHRRRKNKQLLEELTREGSPLHDSPRADDIVFRGSEQASEERLQSNGRAESSAANADSSSRFSDLPGSPAGSPQRSAHGGRSDWVDALCTLLLLQSLPSSALWGIGWLLLQLLGSDMTALQKEVLETAHARGQKEVAAELSGMWCDALALLLVSEWPATRKHLLTPLPQSTSVAIQAWMQACQMSKVVKKGWAVVGLPDMANGWQAGAPGSALLAMRSHHIVQRFVCLASLRQGLLEGSIAEKCPLTPVTEEGVKEREVREGAHVALTSMLPCNVSFTRGQERTVYFAIVGLPEGYSIAAGAGPPEPPLDAGEVLQASPSVVLAEAGPRPGGGKVLSVAPLLGAAASVDSGHPRWLHVHVRPPARGLLKTVRGASIGGMGQQLQRQLVDGHWVLAFRDAGSAQQAAQLVSEHASRLRQHYSAFLAPLLKSTTTDT